MGESPHGGQVLCSCVALPVAASAATAPGGEGQLSTKAETTSLQPTKTVDFLLGRREHHPVSGVVEGMRMEFEWLWWGLRLLALVVIGALALRYLAVLLRQFLDRGHVDPSAASFLVNTVRVVILAVVLLAILQQLGVPTSSLLAVLGAAGLAIALSLQNSLANFAAGLLVLAFRIVRVGDLVEVGDFRGRVEELLPFHVVLVSADNQRITVPNTLLTNGGVRNHSTLPVRRVQWSLPLTGRDDLAAVKDTLRSRLQAEPRILAEPPPQLYLQEWSEDKRLLVVQAWTATANYADVQQEFFETLGASLESLRRGVP
jgi:small conductance mechanosensitive channel